MILCRQLQKITSFFLLFCFFSAFAAAQSIGVSPAKIYFELNQGESKTEKLTVFNKSNQKQVFELSLSDWNRDSLGNKYYTEPGSSESSLAPWLTINPTFLQLGPNESKQVNVILTRPMDADLQTMIKNKRVKWAMLFVKQVNEKTPPADTRETVASQLLIEYRIGVHVYQSPKSLGERKFEIQSFKADRSGSDDNSISSFAVKINNSGKTLGDLKVHLELVNRKTGEQFKQEESSVAMLPQSQRLVFLPMPADIPKGTYTATVVVDSGQDDELKIAELEFEK